MTAKEFFEKYQGRPLYLKEEAQAGEKFTGSVGICNGCPAPNIISVLPTEEAKSKWPYALLIIDECPPVMSFHLEHLAEPIDDIKVLYNLYPHRCKKCKNPARKTNTHILCSNDKCKTRKNFIGALKIKHKPDTIKLNCITCKKPLCFNDRLKATNPNAYYLFCNNCPNDSVVYFEIGKIYEDYYDTFKYIGGENLIEKL